MDKVQEEFLVVDFQLRRVTAVLVALCLLLFSVPAWSEDEADIADEEGSSSQEQIDTAFDMGFDLLVLRPLSAFGLAAGTVLFVPAVIFTAPGGSEGVKDSLDVFVETPWRDLADRPLGDI